MEWQKRKGLWIWDQSACGKWVMGNSLTGACIPQDRNGRSLLPRLSGILLELGLGHSVHFPLLFPSSLLGKVICSLSVLCFCT